MPFAVELDVPSERWSSAVEATAYFVIAEALTNTMKHAGASTATVRVCPTRDGRLRVEVADDGRGGADPAAGTGLAGLRERVRAVGGELSVESTGGTLLIANLPAA